MKDGTTVSLAECALDDLELQFVPTKKAGRKKADDAAGVDNDAAFDAFIQKYDPDNRDEWGAAGICLQAAFGKENAWARGRWVEWSKTSPKYRAGDETEWTACQARTNTRPYRFGRIAKEHGYSGIGRSRRQSSENCSRSTSSPTRGFCATNRTLPMPS
ncbi:MAG: PriCT-2 domain-containing protein [Cypionkella sp.]|nr:PriCT-2 domain-containing protein [Cypionkella sp.]